MECSLKKIPIDIDQETKFSYKYWFVFNIFVYICTSIIQMPHFYEKRFISKTYINELFLFPSQK